MEGEGGQEPVNTSVPPSAPSGGGFMYTPFNNVYLSWIAPEDDGGAPITTYMLSLTPDEQPTNDHILQGPTHFYELALVYGINIQVTVKASNDNGVTYGPDFVFPLIVPIHPPPSPPASAEATTLEPGTASVSWSAPEVAPEGNAHYSVLSVSSNSSDPTVGHGTMDMEQYSCVLTGLNPESEYYFTVEIVNEVGRSPAAETNTFVFSPPTVVEEPAPPTE
jgi:hypothetical protein